MQVKVTSRKRTEGVHEKDHDGDKHEIPDVFEPYREILDEQEDCSDCSHDHPEIVSRPSCFDVGVGGVRKDSCPGYQTKNTENCGINHHMHW